MRNLLIAGTLLLGLTLVTVVRAQEPPAGKTPLTQTRLWLPPHRCLGPRMPAGDRVSCLLVLLVTCAC